MRMKPWTVMTTETFTVVSFIFPWLCQQSFEMINIAQSFICFWRVHSQVVVEEGCGVYLLNCAVTKKSLLWVLIFFSRSQGILLHCFQQQIECLVMLLYFTQSLLFSVSDYTVNWHPKQLQDVVTIFSSGLLIIIINPCGRPRVVWEWVFLACRYWCAVRCYKCPQLFFGFSGMVIRGWTQ